MSIVCAFAFVISLLFSTSYGSTLLGIFDTFTNQFGLLLNVVIQTTLFAIIYGLDNLLPGLNKNATFLKLGKKWMLLVSYFIPLITLLLWIDGVSRNVIFVDTTTMIIELILLMIMIILPIILTKIPSKNDDF